MNYELLGIIITVLISNFGTLFVLRNDIARLEQRMNELEVTIKSFILSFNELRVVYRIERIEKRIDKSPYVQKDSAV